MSFLILGLTEESAGLLGGGSDGGVLHAFLQEESVLFCQSSKTSVLIEVLHRRQGHTGQA